MAFDLQQLNNKLNYGDVMTAADAAETLARQEHELSSEFIVTIYDFMWRPIATAGDDVMELTGSDPRNDLPSAQLTLKGTSTLVPVMMNCSKTMVGVTVETGGMRYAYYVKKHDYKFEKGEWTSVSTLVGIWDVLNYIPIFPEWWLPIQVQLFSHAIYWGPIVTTLQSMISENTLRIQAGIWEFVNNALSVNLDIRAWFGSLLINNFNLFEMLKTPVYVARTSLWTDGSLLMVRTVRMETLATVIKDVIRSTGVCVSVDLWLPGDDQPDHYTQTSPVWRLDHPTYVVTVKDRSQITGPTGTVIDSLIRTFADFGGSIVGELFGDNTFFKQVPGMSDVYYSPALGEHYTPPWAVVIAPEPGEKGSVESCVISDHTQTGWEHIIGGRSPKWLNDLINAFLAWIVDAISIVLGTVGIPSNILSGFLNNSLLAFQLIEFYGRRNQFGVYHPCMSVVHPTPSAPYNLETAFAFINAYWDSRPWTSAVVTFRNNEVYRLGKDVWRGGLMSVVYMGRKRIVTDYIENVVYRFTPDARDVIIQIGDGKAEESPLAKHQRNITGALEAVNVITLAPQM